MTPAYKNCEAIGCGARVPREKLLCTRHWGMLPDRVRECLNAAWRIRLRGGPGALHHRAKIAAIDTVAELEGRYA